LLVTVSAALFELAVERAARRAIGKQNIACPFLNLKIGRIWLAEEKDSFSTVKRARSSIGPATRPEPRVRAGNDGEGEARRAPRANLMDAEIIGHNTGKPGPRAEFDSDGRSGDSGHLNIETPQ